MKKIIAIWLIILYLTGNLFSSCTKKTPSDNPTDPITFSKVFDQFWNGMNTHYLYWHMDTTNWNAVYATYKPLFSKLDINDPTDIQTSVSYFKTMTYGLIDGHFQFFFTRSPMQGVGFYPAFQRKQGSPDFHPAFDYSTIDTAYFDANYMTGNDSLTHKDQAPLHVTFATIHSNILYLSCNEFYLSDAYAHPVNNNVAPVLDAFFSALNKNNIKGLIFDVRNNFGGNLSDLNFLVGRLIDKPLHFGYSRYKSGAGRLDYTPWIEAYVRPQEHAMNITYPVIVLTDAFTVSLAEMVAMAVRVLPNGTIIGETTWGATGPLASNAVFDGGSFTVPGFMTVHTSSAEFKYIDGKMYEDVGFTPDIPIPYNAQAINSGRDPQLEKAVEHIN